MDGVRLVVAVVSLTIMVTGGFFAGQGSLGDVTPENAEGVIYVYTRSDCNACLMAKPIIRRLKSEGFKINEIDVDRAPTKAGKAGVAFLPTFIHYANGRETRRIKGTASERELRRMFRPQ